MKAQDLRIGNIVKVKTTDDDYNIIKEIGYSDNQRCYYLRVENVNHGIWFEHNGSFLVEGVPLTDEWVKRLGFNIPKGGISYDKEKLSLYFGDTILSNEKGRTYFNSWAILEYTPKYVHELQNLYFALTGKELNFKKD